MKTTVTRVALLSAAIGLFSAGAIAHEEDNPEAGPYHYFQHLSEARGQAQALQDQTGKDAGKDAGAAGTSAVQGRVRSEPGGNVWSEDIDRRLAGIGGANTN